MRYKVDVTRELNDGTYRIYTTIFRSLYCANQYYNDMAQDESVVNIEMEKIKWNIQHIT